jgi:glucosylceramidase
MKATFRLGILAGLLALCSYACQSDEQSMNLSIFQTSAQGDKLKPIQSKNSTAEANFVLNPDKKYQSITGFGGAFTESTAHLLNRLSPAKRDSILEAYFGDQGARYSLTRTHMNSCDFSLNNYSYAPIDGDSLLEHFSIEEDEADLIPIIQQAQKISSRGFKIVASPWTAPPWMKSNKDWNGGKLLPEYYDTWALFFSKYYKAYAEKGIDIWAFTVENEPLGNDENWESMHYTPQEMADFVKNHLAPRLKRDEINAKLLVYDQNRGEELEEWAQALLSDEELLPHIYGTAVHWYTSTTDWFPKSLQYTHKLAPDKSIIHTEGCVDAEVPHWRDDAWYWQKEATDWGYDWAKPENKHHHPKYVPTFRYARDIIGCLNNWVEGWIDWNMVLDDKGGPNLAENWCVAPVLVKPEQDEVYFTPLYYVLSHFSRFIEPGARRIDFELSHSSLMATAVENPDGELVAVLLNTSADTQEINLSLGDEIRSISIEGQALQTIIIES